jgi:hypothetical protein
MAVMPHRVAVVWFGSMLAVIAGCTMVDRFHDPYVINRAGVDVTLWYLHNGQLVPLGVTAVDEAATPLSLFRDGCSDGTLYALDPSGHEVGRRATPLCAGDRWTIGTPVGTGPPSPILAP